MVGEIHPDSEFGHLMILRTENSDWKPARNVTHYCHVDSILAILAQVQICEQYPHQWWLGDFSSLSARNGSLFFCGRYRRVFDKKIAETWGLGKRDWFVAKMGDTQNMFLVGSSGLVSDHPFDVGVSYFQIYPNNQTMVILMGKSMTICMTIHDMFWFSQNFQRHPTHILSCGSELLSCSPLVMVPVPSSCKFYYQSIYHLAIGL